MIVVSEPLSRFTLMIIVSVGPVVDVTEVVDEAGAALSGTTIVVFDGGAWATTETEDSKINPTTGKADFIQIQRLAFRLVRCFWVADLLSRSIKVVQCLRQSP